MIKNLVLKNFRKHTDAEFNFSEGLVCVRGQNEAGKTTLAEAILYCLFGSSALRESLDKVVTYDCSESSLKAALVFALDGVDYKIVRGKSGAELTYSSQIVTGQRETKLFVERLLGCTAETAKLLMFADQNSVRGVLSKGGTAANGLVETLAQLGVIEELIDKVQVQLPSGNTKAVESQIEVLRAASVEIPEPPSDSEGVAIEAELLTVQVLIELAQAAKASEDELANAYQAVQVSQAVQAERVRLQDLQTKIEAELATPLVPPFPLQELEQARTNAATMQEQQRRWTSRQREFPEIADEWEGTLESANAFKADKEAAIANLQSRRAETKTLLEVAKVRKITEKACAFCKKDLTLVPEVAEINLQADTAIALHTETIKQLDAGIDTCKVELAAIARILDTHNKVLRLIDEYWDAGSLIPAKPVWIGDAPAQPKLGNLALMEAQWSKHLTQVSKREMLQENLADIEIPEVPDVRKDLELLAVEAARVEESCALYEREEALEAQLALANSTYKFETQIREAALAQAAANAATLLALTDTKDTMLKHNELIKKLRAARPKIAAEMWGTVLGAVSRYFTQIRGEDSTVVRDADGFKVNGRNVEGLSGSTQDALGLAIRMALSKLFLPNVSMLFMDESFSGADRNREMNGVATLAAAGFSQVILVTHSDGPEQIADTLITI